MSIKLVILSNHLILCCPLLFPPSIFSNESVLQNKWLKYWSFSFSISPSNEHPGLISFRMDWFDLLAVQGTLKSSPTPQFKSINSLALSFLYQGFPDSSVGKESACNAEDLDSIPGLGRSPGEGKGYPLQYSGLENSMDYIVHRVIKSRTQLNNFHFHFLYSPTLTSIHDFWKNHSFD